MPCRFASIFSHLTHLTDKNQRSINQTSHLGSIRLILHSLLQYCWHSWRQEYLKELHEYNAIGQKK